MSGFRHMMKRVGGVLVLAAAISAMTASDAQAAQMLRLTQGASSVQITDGGVGDSNPFAGAITFIGSVGSYFLNVSTGVSKPVLGSAANPHMDLASLNMSGSGMLTIEHTDTDFVGTGPFAMHIGGTTNGSVSYAAYFDSTNAAFGTGSAIDSLGPFGGPAFAGSGGGGNAVITPYSLTQVVTLTHTGFGISSFDAELIPEPATLALFGLGLIGVGAATSRRLRRARS
jgi:hypothetical protein